MSISKSDVETLIKDEFQTMLTGYFHRPDEGAENSIVVAFNPTNDTTNSGFEIKECCCAGHDQYRLVIKFKKYKEPAPAEECQGKIKSNQKIEDMTLNDLWTTRLVFLTANQRLSGMAPKDLQGALLRNRPRIESNLLTAVQKMIQAERPHWNAGIISKVIVEIG